MPFIGGRQALNTLFILLGEEPTMVPSGYIEEPELAFITDAEVYACSTHTTPLERLNSSFAWVVYHQGTYIWIASLPPQSPILQQWQQAWGVGGSSSQPPKAASQKACVLLLLPPRCG